MEPALRREQAPPASDEERLGVEWEARQPWNRRMGPGSSWRNGVDELVIDEKQDLYATLEPLYAPLLVDLFVDHRPVVLSVLDKRSGSDGVLPLHHDPTFVHEPVERSVTLWIALDDIGERPDNGPLHVLPGSHRAAEHLRGTRIEPLWQHDIERLWAHTLPIEICAGDAVVWDSRLVHGSSPNRSGRPRRAAVGVIVPRSAPLLHAAADESDKIAVFEVDDEFYRWCGFRAIREEPPDELPSAVVERPAPHTTEDYLALADRHRRMLPLRWTLAQGRRRTGRAARKLASAHRSMPSSV